MKSARRFARVTLLGEPNSGKSTLINAIVGQKLMAVHEKAQMTRHNRPGIYTKDNVQLFFLDTPGFHKPRFQLNSVMVRHLNEAVDTSDIVVVLIDVTSSLSPILKSRIDVLLDQKKLLLFALNKIDLFQKDWRVNEKTVAECYPGARFCFVSAKTGRGVEDLLKCLTEMAPQAKFAHDPDVVTTAGTRELAIDFIREAMMDFLDQELPYQTSVQIESYDEKPARDRIKAVIIVNRESQKGIVVGKRGQTIGKIRMLAEKELSQVIQKKIDLRLFVKVDPGWVDDPVKTTEYL